MNPRAHGRPISTARRASRRRWLALALAVSVPLVGAALCSAQRETTAEPTPAVARDTVPHARPTAPALTLAPAAAPPSPADGVERSEVPGLAPLIEEVLIDRRELCTREPAVVRVRLRADAKPPLRVAINGQSGSVLPVAFNAPGSRLVVVRATAAGGAEDERKLRLAVRNCGDDFQYVKIDSERKTDAAIDDVYRFSAQPFFARPECQKTAGIESWLRCNAELEPGETRTYAWDFGDGSSEVTTSGYVEHDFSHRPALDVESSFLVKVEVVSSVHGPIRGFSALTLENKSVENKLRLGVVTPLASAACKPWKPGAALRCEVTFRNTDPAPISLDELEAIWSPCRDDGKAETSKWPARRKLSSVTLPSGKSSATLELAAGEIERSACSVAFRAVGFASKFKAESVFGTQLSFTPELLGPNEVAASPEAKRRYDRVLRALRLLGRDQETTASVTDDEIRALEMKDLL
jgi:hypothetical protein